MFYYKQRMSPDFENKNLDSLLSNLHRLRKKFDATLHECKLVASEVEDMATLLPRLRKKKSLEQDRSTKMILLMKKLN